MILDPLTQRVKPVLYQSKWRRFVIGVMVLSSFIIFHLLPHFSFELEMIALVTLGLIYLEVMIDKTIYMNSVALSTRNDVKELKTRTEKFTVDSAIYQNEPQVRRHLIDLIEEEAPNTIFMMEYSCHYGRYLLEEANKVNSDVYLLIKNPSSVIFESMNQEQRILRGIKEIKNSMDESFYSNLNIRLYDTAPAVRGRRIGDSHLTLGWYRFEGTPDTDIWGHTNPIIVTSHDDDKFDLLDQWFREEVYLELFSSGKKLTEARQNEKCYDELRTWAYAEKNERFVEATSDYDAEEVENILKRSNDI